MCPESLYGSRPSVVYSKWVRIAPPDLVAVDLPKVAGYSFVSFPCLSIAAIIAAIVLPIFSHARAKSAQAA